MRSTVIREEPVVHRAKATIIVEVDSRGHAAAGRIGIGALTDRASRPTDSHSTADAIIFTFANAMLGIFTLCSIDAGDSSSNGDVAANRGRT